MTEEYKDILIENLKKFINSFNVDLDCLPGRMQADYECLWLEATRQADERNAIK